MRVQFGVGIWNAMTCCAVEFNSGGASTWRARPEAMRFCFRFASPWTGTAVWLRTYIGLSLLGRCSAMRSTELRWKGAYG